jgi:hypothetical protein
MMDRATPYQVGKIRELLLAAFTADGLRRFCHDRPTFRPIVDTFGPSDGLDDIADKIIIYCESQLLFPDLLFEVMQENPRQYAHFEGVLGTPQVLSPGSSNVTIRETGRQEPIAETGDQIKIGHIGSMKQSVIGSGTVNVHQGLGGDELTELFASIYECIKARPPDPDVDKEELSENVQRIEREAAKGEEANDNKIERWLRTLAAMAPDIFEVTVAALTHPLAGVATAIRKIALKASEEAQ